MRKLLPRSPTDRIAVGFTMFALFLVFFFEALMVLPHLYSHAEGPGRPLGYYLHYGLGVFLMVNTLWNYLATVLTDTTTGAVILPAVLQPGWRYCSHCLQNLPSRSFHCYTCGVCVLKRDHHCVFAGKCVGHQNQRYYVMTLIYIWLGSLYANYLNFDLALTELGGLGVKAIFTMFFPFGAWLFGLAEDYSLLVCFVCGLCLLGCAMASVLLYYYGGNTLRGQTTHERMARNRDYDLGWRRNLVEACGSHWYAVWLLPLVPSPLPGDGFKFPTRDSIAREDSKHI